MEKINIGQIVGAVGLKGEFKVYDYGEDMNRYARFKYIYIEDERHELKKARVQKNVVVLLCEGIDDRDKAEKLRGRNLYIDEEQLPRLPEGTYYIRDLIGFDIADENGQVIGSLVDISKSTAQPLYEIKTLKGKAAYIPGVDEFILKTDIENRTITVKIIEGLID